MTTTGRAFPGAGSCLDGLVRNNADCDDSNPGVTDGTACYTDADGDGWGGVLVTKTCGACAAHTTPRAGDCNDADKGAGAVFDCNDADGSVHPEQAERPANGVDDDCNGTVDETAFTYAANASDVTTSARCPRIRRREAATLAPRRQRRQPRRDRRGRHAFLARLWRGAPHRFDAPLTIRCSLASMDWVDKHFGQKVVIEAPRDAVQEAAGRFATESLREWKVTPTAEGFDVQGMSAFHQVLAHVRFAQAGNGTEASVEMLVKRMGEFGDYMLVDIGGYYDGLIRKWLWAIWSLARQSHAPSAGPVVAPAGTVAPHVDVGARVFVMDAHGKPYMGVAREVTPQGVRVTYDEGGVERWVPATAVHVVSAPP